MTTRFFARVAELEQQGAAAAVVVVVDTEGHAPQLPGARMIVHADGTVEGTVGGGRVEHEVVAAARQAIAAGRPRTVRYRLQAELGMCCGGAMTFFVDPIGTTDRVVVFGAGHVARPTAQVAALCGFEVHVVDPRPDWNTPARFPDATRHVEHHADFLAHWTWRQTDSVVIATPNHDHDREILGICLQQALRYVGMIGSTRKVQRARMALRAEGLSEALLDRAHAPIGLDILAETPEEIAVSIVAEIIRVRRAPASRKRTRAAPVRERRATQTSAEADTS